MRRTPLAEIFGVSRERIRKVLHRLGAERRLEMIPNRGARVPRPTLDDVRSVYEAHRVLEAGVLAQLVRLVDDALLERLDAHLAEERAAAKRGDRAASVRLSARSTSIWSRRSAMRSCRVSCAICSAAPR